MQLRLSERQDLKTPMIIVSSTGGHMQPSLPKVLLEMHIAKNKKSFSNWEDRCQPKECILDYNFIYHKTLETN